MGSVKAIPANGEDSCTRWKKYTAGTQNPPFHRFTTAAKRAIIHVFARNGNVLPEPDAESRVAGVNADRQG